MFGQLLPMAKAVPGTNGWRPSRPLGGWLATYGQIGPNGGVIPTQDRQGHVFEAAGTLGRIDFSPYLRKGLWNDTHTDVIVGVPTGLEFHDQHTDLAKAHRKVGFWTEGHLYDRHDPRSWTLFGEREPTEKDLEKADHYWNLANMLKGVPRPLGMSAQGKMLISKCGKRIIWAQISKNAICEVPQNPDAIAVPLALAVPDGVVITPDMVGANPCAGCTCPPGARCPVVPAAKGIVVNNNGIPLRQDVAEEQVSERNKGEWPAAVMRLVELVMEQSGATEADAKRWVRKFLYRNYAAQPRQERA